MTAQPTRRRVSPSEEFFERIAEEPQPLLRDVAAKIRIDIEDHGRDTRTWLVRIDHGRVHVAERGGKADAVVRTDRGFFDQLATGEANSLSAALRGRLVLEGDIRLLVAFGRLLPSPPGGRTIVPEASRTAKEAARAVKAAGTVTRTGRVSAAAARAAAATGSTRKDHGR